jgi:hypothetical protein
MKATAIQIIQAMLAPGVMVSACGLLLLGMNSRYSLIVNRIRLLKQEGRGLGEEPEEREDLDRAESIELQLAKLLDRLRLVRNAVFSFSIGMAFFIASSLFIGLQFVTEARPVQAFVLVCFLAGMLSIMAGLILAGIEVRKGYRIVLIETDQMQVETEKRMAAPAARRARKASGRRSRTKPSRRN